MSRDPLPSIEASLNRIANSAAIIAGTMPLLVSAIVATSDRSNEEDAKRINEELMAIWEAYQ